MSDSLMEKIIGNKKLPIPLVSGGKLNDSDWQLAGVPLGDGNFWMYRDNNARVIFSGDTAEIDIPRFSTSHDQVPMFDNPKQLYLTKGQYEPGPKGLIGFVCKMKSEIVNGDLRDYRDGFGAFNVLDFGSAMVFDIVSNGHKVWIIYERLFIPGVTAPEEAFTKVIDIGLDTAPDKIMECAVIYDRNGDRAEYYIDGKMVYRVEKVPVKVDRFQTGFGIITLHPIENGKSVSCKGQGGRGSWAGFNIYRA
jgi:hypothetical protein